ncbi:MAG: class I SAM-dependent methyltransferase [Candidatus Rokuibacteriota bacterium]
MGRPLAEPPPANTLTKSMWNRPTPPRRDATLQDSVERLLALGYAHTYDRIVRAFQPYQDLLREVTAYIDRSVAGSDPRDVRILDVASGTGTVAFELARRGYSVLGVDLVASLVKVARDRRGVDAAPRVDFQQLDVARDTVPGSGSYDVLISMHTLYWHPDPIGLLQGCQRALKPGGHAIFLTYSRPAHVLPTFQQVRARHGRLAALRALRWLIPTAVFELFRDYEPHYMSPDEFHRTLAAAGFDVLEFKQTFLAGISLLAWTQAKPAPR